MSILNKTSQIQQFPFQTSVPFPLGLIQNIQIVLKTSDEKPFVSAIGGSVGIFIIQLQTQDTYLGSFSYQNNLWITIDNEQVFGFIKLSTLPVQSFSYSGKWFLQRSCYNFATKLDGLQKICLNNLQLPQTQILDLQFTGDFSYWIASDSSVINIGKNAESNYGQYTQGGYTLQDCVLSINDYNYKKLIITSSDSKIQISEPIAVADSDIYILYIGTTKEFKNCDFSDSMNT